ncbi:hypothetical protein KOW79_010565 [Hemibagrus wyckioides]|uniref:Uncharacterized protein n=1 Tax=Hemibagrus wyckioides TaxID=337641 RepID=A0A9D3SJ36_9TELE|nr:hypothetical protein KOW79_010565 [Hemibagrus wyckioides]
MRPSRPAEGAIHLEAARPRKTKRTRKDVRFQIIASASLLLSAAVCIEIIVVCMRKKLSCPGLKEISSRRRQAWVKVPDPQ